MKKIKILFSISNFNIGGPQKSLLALLYKLDYEKYDCYLIVLSGEGSLLKYLPGNITVLKTPLEIKYALISKKQLKSSTIKMIKKNNLKLVFNAIGALIKGIKLKNMGQARQKYWLNNYKKLPKLEGDFDVAIGVSGGHSMMFINDCVNAGKRISWIRSDYRVLKRNLDIDNYYVEAMDSILSVSHECKNIFDDLFPKQSSKTVVMYNVLPFDIYKEIEVDTSVMSENIGRINILTICRLDPNKGLDLAMEAMSILIKTKWDIKWYILGDGKYKKHIENQILERGLQEHFILLGFQLNTMAFIEKCDILVHPSRFEGKSNVVDEAKYLSKPIVVTRYETVKEQIEDGQTGLIAEMSADSIVGKIEVLLNSAETRQKLVDNLANQKFNDEESLKIFQEIVEN